MLKVSVSDWLYIDLLSRFYINLLIHLMLKVNIKSQLILSIKEK